MRSVWRSNGSWASSTLRNAATHPHLRPPPLSLHRGLLLSSCALMRHAVRAAFIGVWTVPDPRSSQVVLRCCFIRSASRGFPQTFLCTCTSLHPSLWRLGVKAQAARSLALSGSARLRNEVLWEPLKSKLRSSVDDDTRWLN